jgi:hypothetical protein
LEKCPPAAQAGIASARFASLTWISQTGGARDLNLLPEALDSGYAALEVAGDRAVNETPWIRTWLARNAPDLTLLEPVFDATDLHTRAEAFGLVDNTPEAIRCYLKSIEDVYSARSMQSLISQFAPSGLAHTVDYLIELVLQESRDDFFAIWELGLWLLPYRARPELAEARLEEHLKLIAARIEELSRFEFQHLLRAYEFYDKAGRQDRAAAMLTRAIKLADSPEENLSLAVAHRRLAGFAESDRARHGLICLRQAEKEAGERLERLEIARECGYYGQVQQARRILQAEGVFSSETNFEPVEYIAALQSAPWLTPEEFHSLGQQAFLSFLRDITTGVIRHQNAFLERLLQTIAAADNEFADRLRKGWTDLVSRGASTNGNAQSGNNGNGTHAKPAAVPEWDGESWRSWKTAMRARHDSRDVDGERDLLEKMIATLSDEGLGQRLAVWSFMSGVIETEIARSAKVRPQIEASRTPFSRSGNIVDDWRAQEVSDLWRKYIDSHTEEEDERALTEIKEFFVEEKRLLDEWETKRFREAAESSQRASYFSDAAKSILEPLLAPPEDGLLPVIKGIRENLARDATMLLERLEKRRRPPSSADPAALDRVST